MDNGRRNALCFLLKMAAGTATGAGLGYIASDKTDLEDQKQKALNGAIAGTIATRVVIALQERSGPRQ